MVVDAIIFFMISFVCGMVLIPIILHIIKYEVHIYGVFAVSLGVSLVIAFVLGVVLNIPIREIAMNRSFLTRY